MIYMYAMSAHVHILRTLDNILMRPIGDNDMYASIHGGRDAATSPIIAIYVTMSSRLIMALPKLYIPTP